MFIEATEDFKPGVPSTHVKYKHQNKPGTKVLIIQMPEGQLIPYDPVKHNDPEQENYIKRDHALLKMSYKSFWKKTSKNYLISKAAKEEKKARIPTNEEINIITASTINAYLAAGFVPDKEETHIKYDSNIHHHKMTEIVVLVDKIYGGCYQPYEPGKHGTEAARKNITVNCYTVARSRANKKYEKWLENSKNSSPSASSDLQYKTFMPHMLVHDFKQIDHLSETHSQENESQSINSSSHKRKETSDSNKILIPTTIKSPSNFFEQGHVKESVQSDEQRRVKPFRPWE